jgi:hypothetical protein
MKPSDVIRQHGWIKGRMCDTSGYCSTGAWALAHNYQAILGKGGQISATVQMLREEFEARFMEIAQRKFPTRFPAITRPPTFVTSFNDLPETTVGDLTLKKMEADETLVTSFNDLLETTVEEVLLILEELEADEPEA